MRAALLQIPNGKLTTLAANAANTLNGVLAIHEADFADAPYAPRFWCPFCVVRRRPVRGVVRLPSLDVVRLRTPRMLIPLKSSRTYSDATFSIVVSGSLPCQAATPLDMARNARVARRQ